MISKVHFMVHKGSEAELAARLAQLGFENVRALPNSCRVLVSAGEKEFGKRLGIVFAHEQRERVMGIQQTSSTEAVVADYSKLPPQIAELVESCHTPVAPNRLQ